MSRLVAHREAGRARGLKRIGEKNDSINYVLDGAQIRDGPGGIERDGPVYSPCANPSVLRSACSARRVDPVAEEEEEAPGVVEGPEEAPEDMVMAQGENPENMPRIPVYPKEGIRVSGSPGLTLTSSLVQLSY